MSNPVLREDVVDSFSTLDNELETSTVSGTVLKTLFSLAILCATASYPFMTAIQAFTAGSAMPDKVSLMAVFGSVGAFIVALIIAFTRNPKTLAPLTILYSGLEGLAIGGISAVFAAQFGFSIILHAILGTFATLAVMLFLYSARIIKCTEKFRATIFVATLSIAAIYLVSWVLSFFNAGAFNWLVSNSNIGIGVSVVIVAIAAFNFIVDFDIIEKMQESRLNKAFEWYGAFSLMITLVWLYIEILRLLAKVNSRR